MIKKIITFILLATITTTQSNLDSELLKQKAALMKKSVCTISEICQLLLKNHKAETILFQEVLEFFDTDLQSLLIKSHENRVSAQELYALISYVAQDQSHLEAFLSKLKQDFCL